MCGKVLALTFFGALTVAECTWSSTGEVAGCPYFNFHTGETRQVEEAAVEPQQCSHRSVSLDGPPEAGQKTVMGCSCVSSCGATIDDEFKCDWCHTANSCGHFGFSGHYDYCIYPDDSTFEAKTFQEKNTYFQTKLTADTTRNSYPSPAAAFTESMQTSFYDFRDEMPQGRVKVIHSVGAVCQFQLDVAANSPYTGLFASGSQFGFIRMGGAASWDVKDTVGPPPGLGIKFARSGIHSGSYVALVSVDAHTFNFMQYNFSNHIGPSSSIPTKVLAKKFQQASQCPAQVGLSDMATYSQSGERVATPKTPFKLYLVPTPEVQKANTPKSIDTMMSELSFPVGTNLMTAYACGEGQGNSEVDPTAGGVDVACGKPFKLGQMVTTTQCTTSSYGDKSFFIRHQPIEEDWKLHPEMMNQFGTVGVDKVCGWSGPPITVDGLPPQCGLPPPPPPSTWTWPFSTN